MLLLVHMQHLRLFLLRILQCLVHLLHLRLHLHSLRALPCNFLQMWPLRAFPCNFLQMWPLKARPCKIQILDSLDPADLSVLRGLPNLSRWPDNGLPEHAAAWFDFVSYHAGAVRKPVQHVLIYLLGPEGLSWLRSLMATQQVWTTAELREAFLRRFAGQVRSERASALELYPTAFTRVQIPWRSMLKDF